jgi:hypothetical protein
VDYHGIGGHGVLQYAVTSMSSAANGRVFSVLMRSIYLKAQGR